MLPFQPALSADTNRPASIVSAMEFLRRYNQCARFLVIPVIAVLLADVATKAVTRHELDRGEHYWLVDGWLGLQLTENRGLAFGIGSDSQLVTAFVLVGIAVLAWLIWRSELIQGSISWVALGLTLGGALGNLFDRLPDGAVTDFLVVGSWPRFNVADSALTIGLIGLAFLEIRSAGRLRT